MTGIIIISECYTNEAELIDIALKLTLFELKTIYTRLLPLKLRINLHDLFCLSSSLNKNT